MLRAILVLSLVFHPFIVLAKEPAGRISPEDKKRVEESFQAVADFTGWLRKPSQKKFRDVFKMVKPFMDPDALEDISQLVGDSRMNHDFPKFRYTPGKEISTLKVSAGGPVHTILIRNSDPEVLFVVNGKKITHAEVLTSTKWVQTLKDALLSKEEKPSAWNWLVPQAHAFLGITDWSSILGSALLGGGILGAGYFISKGMKNFGSKLPTNFNVNVPTNYAVQWPSAYSFTGQWPTQYNANFGANLGLSLPRSMGSASQALPAIPNQYFPVGRMPATGLAPATISPSSQSPESAR